MNISSTHRRNHMLIDEQQVSVRNVYIFITYQNFTQNIADNSKEELRKICSSFASNVRLNSIMQRQKDWLQKRTKYILIDILIDLLPFYNNNSNYFTGIYRNIFLVYVEKKQLRRFALTNTGINILAVLNAIYCLLIKIKVMKKLYFFLII